MAVSEQEPYKEYIANGITQSFALEFDCENQGHLLVRIDEEAAAVGSWSFSNGAVVFNSAPANGKKITIQRNTPFARSTNFQSSNNSFRPETLNKDLDRIWLKLQELGITDHLTTLYVQKLHNEQWQYIDDKDQIIKNIIADLRNYVNQQDSGINSSIGNLKSYLDQQDNALAQSINSLRNYTEQQDNTLNQGINDLRTYVNQQDNNQKSYFENLIGQQGVSLQQLDSYYNYLMSRIAEIAVDKGWDASFVVDESGDTQQQINDRIGNKWYEKPLGYSINDRVMLENGDIVKSTVANNIVNPNIDMSGWVKANAASQVITSSGLNQEETNALKAGKAEVLPSTQTKDSFKNAYSTPKANLFEQLRAMSACGCCYVWKNPLHAGQADYRFSVGINMSGFKTAEWKFIADADNFIRMEYGYTGAIRSPTGFTDATNRVGTVSGGSGNNVYFATVDSSFDLVFTGTGLLINQFVDANGGIFDVYLDGVLLRKMSANINNPENTGAISGNIQKLVVGDLENTAHTVKFVFKGADPSYPPTTSARGWFKNFTGADAHTATVITGAEMGMSPTGAKLVANGIIDFAISSRAFGTSMPYDWTPSHSGAAGAMVVHSRKIYIDSTLVDDSLTTVGKEKEFKEFTLIQRYTAYNSNDTAKAYPLYEGLLVTKFDRVNGLSYAHEINTLSKLDTSEGFMQMLSGRRSSDLLKFETDNGQTVELSGAAPAADKQEYVGVVKSARWMGNSTGLAISVDSPEAASSLGKTYADANPTMFNERTDGFCKLYFKTMGRNSVIEAGTKFVTRHKVWLATF